MFLIYQQVDNQNGILNGTITNLKDILNSIENYNKYPNSYRNALNDIKDADYLFLDLDGTLIDYIETNHDIINGHSNDCKLQKHSEIKLTSAQIYRFFYLTEMNINNTINEFKKLNTNLQVISLSRSWPGRKINGIYSREKQLKRLGINVLQDHIWTNHIDKGVFLAGWNGNLKEYCKCCYDFSTIEVKPQLGYLDKNPHIIGKKIVIIDNDEKQLKYIYDAYKAKYPKHLDKLKLYLYKNEFVTAVENGDQSVSYKIENAYCTCKFTKNKLINHNIIKINSINDIKKIKAKNIFLNVYSVTQFHKLSDIQNHNNDCNLFKHIKVSDDNICYEIEDNIWKVFKSWESNGSHIEVYTRDTPIYESLFEIFKKRTIDEQIIVIDNDMNELIEIYQYCKKHYPKHLNKLMLYLYEPNQQINLSQLTEKYCDCVQNGGTQNV